MSWLDTLSEIRERDWDEVPDPEREKAAREVTEMASYASAVSGAVPVPFVDVALLLPIHSVMVMTVGAVYGRSLSKTEAKRVAVELGAIAGVTLAGHVAISALKSLIPPVKWLTMFASAASSFAITWGFGSLTVAYFKHPELSKDDLAKIFKDALSEGGKMFSKEAFERFRSEDHEPPPTDPEASEEAAEEPVDEDVDTSKQAETRESMRPKKRSL